MKMKLHTAAAEATAEGGALMKTKLHTAAAEAAAMGAAAEAEAEVKAKVVRS